MNFEAYSPYENPIHIRADLAMIFHSRMFLPTSSDGAGSYSEWLCNESKSYSVFGGWRGIERNFGLEIWNAFRDSFIRQYGIIPVNTDSKIDLTIGGQWKIST